MLRRRLCRRKCLLQFERCIAGCGEDTSGRPSQGKSILEYRFANQWVKRSGDDQIHAAVKQVFKINKQAARKPWSCGTNNVNQEIDIALGVGVPARNRAEDTDITSTVLRCNRLDFGFSSSKRFEHIHGFILNPKSNSRRDAELAKENLCVFRESALNRPLLNYSSGASPSSLPCRIAFNRSSRRFARSAARFTSSLPTSSIMACSAPSPLRLPRRTMRV